MSSRRRHKTLRLLLCWALVAGVFFIGNQVLSPNFNFRFLKRPVVQHTVFRNQAQAKFHATALSMVDQKDHSVNLKSLRPELDSALFTAALLARSTFGENFTLVVTSGDDSMEHMTNSAHYNGAAVDIRTKNMQRAHRRIFAEKLQQKLGSRFNVLFESAGRPSEHIHIQLNSKHYDVSEQWQ